MKLSQWAKEQGLCYHTAWRLFKDGKLPVRAEQLETGTILVHPEKEPEGNGTWLYCRVSSHGQKENLVRQKERCLAFCCAKGWTVDKIVCEVASGLNDSRPRLLKMLDARPARIVVEHKDRLTRFGFAYFEKLLPMLGCELVVINRAEEQKEDMVADMVAIITSFCCRLYGMRRGRQKSKRVKELLS